MSNGRLLQTAILGTMLMLSLTGCSGVPFATPISEDPAATPTPVIISTHTPHPTLTPTPSPIATSTIAPTLSPLRAFAEPILTTIASSTPDYADDFDNPNSGWTTGMQYEGAYKRGNTGYVYGEYLCSAGGKLDTAIRE